MRIMPSIPMFMIPACSVIQSAHGRQPHGSGAAEHLPEQAGGEKITHGLPQSGGGSRRAWFRARRACQAAEMPLPPAMKKMMTDWMIR